VPSMMTAGTRIHMEKAECLIAHDFQNVGMTADEQSRPLPAELLQCTPVVITRIAADVCHIACEAIAIPDEILRDIGTEPSAVDVSVNAPKRLERPERLQNIDRSEVACVPDLIAFGEMPENSVVEKSVCVG